MSTPLDGPAFPHEELGQTTYDKSGMITGCNVYQASPGITMRQYAAIHLCVPESGIPELDDMIRKAQRDSFAGQALVGLALETNPAHADAVARCAYALADAMPRAREGGQK